VKTCPACGQVADPHDTFCQRCGNRLDRSADPQGTGGGWTTGVPAWSAAPEPAAPDPAVPHPAAPHPGQLPTPAPWPAAAQPTAAAPAPWAAGQVPPPAASASGRGGWVEGPPEHPDDDERSGGRRWVLVALAAAVVVAVAVVGFLVLRDGDPDRTAAPSTSAPGSTTSAPPSSAPAEDADPTGATGTAASLGPVDPAGYTSWNPFTSAVAPATSPNGVDAAGNPTDYAAANMLDLNPGTTWRMDGDGRGAVLEFSLGSQAEVTTLGLVNGYDKRDPATGEDRYAQARRITQVTWEVGDASYVQVLDDGVRSMQAISFPPVEVSTVRLRIDVVTGPGDAAFDRTAISDVLIAGG